MGTNPFDPQTSGTLSKEEQAEYDRLEALEQERATEGDCPLTAEEQQGRDGVQIDDRDRDVPAELDQSDPDAEQAYPVQNGAVKWDDAANSGDTSRQTTAVYDTPWGRRALSQEEVNDFRVQGVPIRYVDDQAQTSLQQEQDEMSKVDLDFKPQS
jgi:hypothetical protein